MVRDGRRSREDQKGEEEIVGRVLCLHYTVHSSSGSMLHLIKMLNYFKKSVIALSVVDEVISRKP